MEEEIIKCPLCESEEVIRSLDLQNDNELFGFEETYKCEKCGLLFDGG